MVYNRRIFILGSARASRAGDGALAVADLFPMKDVMRRAQPPLQIPNLRSCFRLRAKSGRHQIFRAAGHDQFLSRGT
jgi:hypothetical protein